MTRIDRPIAAMFFSLVLCSAHTTVAAQTGPAANSSQPVSIQAPPQPIADDVDELEENAATADAAIETEQPATYAPPAHESLPLGVPLKESSTDAGAALDSAPGLVDSEDEKSAAWYSWFDPRDNDITRVGGALFVVIGLLALIRALIRRNPNMLAGGGRPSGIVEILARYPVGRGQQLILLKLARRVLLVHHAGTTMTTLSELTEGDEVAAMLSRVEAGARKQDAKRFRAMLDDFQKQHNSEPKPARRISPNTLQSEPSSSTVIDLTRSQAGGVSRVLKRLGVTS